MLFTRFSIFSLPPLFHCLHLSYLSDPYKHTLDIYIRSSMQSLLHLVSLMNFTYISAPVLTQPLDVESLFLYSSVTDTLQSADDTGTAM